MLTTDIYEFPYPEGSDLVQDGNDMIQALAEAVEAAMNPPWVALSLLGANYSPRAGYLPPAYRVYDDGQVQLRGGLTKGTAMITGDTLFTIPVDGRPTANVAFGAVVNRSDATKSPAAKITISTAGLATVEVIDSQVPLSIVFDGAEFSKGP
jgi:hypothetical protein